MEEDKAKNSNQSANNQNQNQNPKSSKINKKGYLIAGIVVIAIIAIIFAFGGSSQTVVAGDNVSVYYTGSFPNGTVFNTNVGGAPLNFTAGSNQLIPGFSDAVIGMKVGQNKTVTLTPNEAYGYFNQSLVQKIPLSMFGNNATNSLKVGMVVRTQTGLEGFVIGLNNTIATVNFNPPLAGKTLIFNIKLVSINKH
ncbi:MAG: FKBP-type peptidyl-prolyl cis-trans isomerase [Candidatus Micrarchaeia archaeon]